MIMVIIVITIKQNISHYITLFKNFVSNLHAYTTDMYLRDSLFKRNKNQKVIDEILRPGNTEVQN